MLYASIDDDILNLMDEVKIDIFLKEASDAIDDPGKLAEFIQEKASVAIERFLVSSAIAIAICIHVHSACDH